MQSFSSLYQGFTSRMTYDLDLVIKYCCSFVVMFRKASSVLRLPSSLVGGIFRHFSALRVSKDALEAVQVG